MEILLNGETFQLTAPEVLSEFLDKHSINLSFCAVAVNRKVIPRSELSKVQVQEGDQIEIVQAVGGG